MLLFTKILLVIFHLLFLPINTITVLLLCIYKLVVVLLAKCTQNFVRPVPSSGCIFTADNLWTSPNSSIVAAVELDKIVNDVELAPHFHKLYDLQTENGERCYKDLGYYPVPYFGYLFWKEVENFKIINRIHIFNERVGSGEEPLSSVGEKLMKEPYQKGDPLWDVYLVYKQNKTVVFLRFHHILADGMSLVKLCYALFGVYSLPSNFTKPSTSLQRWERLSTSILAKIGAFFSLVTVGFIEYLDQVLISQDRNPVNFDSQDKLRLSGKWICNIGKVYNVKDLKAASKAYQCSILHLMLTAISKGLAKYFEKYYHDEPPPKDVHFVFPVPIPGHPDLKLINHWALARILSRLDISETTEKIAEVQSEFKQAVVSPLPLISSFMFRYICGLLTIPLINAISRAKATSTIVFSNVVGPQTAGFIGKDIKVTHMFFWMPIVRESMALSIGVVSYNGGLCFCLTGDLGCIPDRSHLDDLTGMIYEELTDICNKKSQE